MRTGTTAEQVDTDKVISPALRMQALLQATMNDEKAELCSADQPALRKFFEINAALFREIAS